jgi:hypothetical protein
VNRLFYLTLSALLVVSGVTLAEGKPGRKHGKHRESTREAAVHGRFSQREILVIREYYAPRYRALPPGLQKKVHRTGQLPPGWQKKFEPFPIEVERNLIDLPRGYRRGIIDGHAVVVDSIKQRIVDVAVLF